MKHLELFSGIGGFRRAMDLLTIDKIMNFESIGYSEIDTNAIKTYTANYNPKDTEIALGDIVEFTSDMNNIEGLPHFDLLTGGFPCQTFSMMGKKEGFNEDRGQMFFKILDILRIKRPKYVLLENVKNLYTHDKKKTFQRIKFELESLGYNVISNIFNTSSFHLPQNRSRILIFATTNAIPDNFAESFNSDKVKAYFDKFYKKSSLITAETVIDFLKKKVEQKYFLSERIKPTILSDGSGKFKSNSEINQEIARPLTASMHKMHRACQDNYYSSDYIESKGLINPAKTKSKEELAKLPIRRITPEEAFLLQGFPEEFVIKARTSKVSDIALYKQAGNAVSVNTIYAVLYFLIKNNIITESEK